MRIQEAINIIKSGEKFSIEDAVNIYAKINLMEKDLKGLKEILATDYLLPTKQTHYDLETEKQIIFNSGDTVLDVDNEGIFAYLWLRERRQDIFENFTINLKGIDKLEDAKDVRNKFVKDKGDRKVDNLSVKNIPKKELKRLKEEKSDETN